MNKKIKIVRDFIVYILSSVYYLFFKFRFISLFKDVFYFFKWIKYRNYNYSLLFKRIPWLNFESISFLEGYLKKEMKVFEFGSGGSTLFFSDRVNELVSIEHDQNWYDLTNKSIVDLKLTHVDYNHISPFFCENLNGLNCQDPLNYISCNSEYKNYNFSQYVKAIDRFPDRYFDLVFIDGRARPSCILHSIKKVKKNGILFIDNTDRTYYLKGFPQLMDTKVWRKLNFVGHFPNGSASVLSYSTAYVKLN